MRLHRAAALVACLLAFGHAAQAQTRPRASAPATTVGPVTVTAKHRPGAPQSPTEEISSFIRSHVTKTRTGRLARWRQPICPITFGGPEADNAFITARIEAVAQNAGVPIDASPKCLSNIEVIFSDHPQALIDLIDKRHPLYIGYHYEAQRKALTRFDRPIKSWYVTGSRGYGTGQAVAPPSMAPGSDAAAGELVLDETWASSPSGASDSRMDTSITTELVNALIIVDQAKVAGFTIGSIADYVAMLALTQPAAPDACDSLDSILDLFAANCRDADKPQQLTASDTAYLAALYQANLDLAANIAEGAITDRMKAASTR